MNFDLVEIGPQGNGKWNFEEVILTGNCSVFKPVSPFFLINKQNNPFNIDGSALSWFGGYPKLCELSDDVIVTLFC